MLCRTIVAITLFAASLGFAPAPVYRERPAPKDVLRRMQGTWQLNTSAGPGGRRSIWVRIKDDTWTYVFVTNGVESEGSPSRVILGLERGLTTLDLELRHPVPGVTPLVLRGLVKVEGDRLAVCYSPTTNASRPSAFADRAPRVGELADKDISPFTMTLRKLKAP